MTRSFIFETRLLSSSKKDNAPDLIDKWTDMAVEKCSLAPEQFQTMCKLVTKTALDKYLNDMAKGEVNFCENTSLCQEGPVPPKPVDKCTACINFTADLQDWIHSLYFQEALPTVQLICHSFRASK